MTHKNRSTGAKDSALRDFFTPGRIAVLALAAVALLFVSQNTRRTPVRLLIPEVELPLWLVLFATLVVGAICGYSLHSRDRRRRQ